MIKTMAFFLIICLLTLCQVQAKTIYSANCSQKDVQNAINAAADGDTVIVPAGKSIWSKAVVHEYPKSIFIKGAGIDKTIIYDGTNNEWGQTPFWINVTDGKFFRISGFTIKCTQADPNGGLLIDGECKNFRIDHCKFDSIRARGIRIQGYIYGVIDSCIFTDYGNYTAQAIIVLGDENDSYARPLSLGSSEAVYIENCIFDFKYENDGALDAGGGGRYVFRYNEVKGTTMGHHGLDSTPQSRSAFSFEIYENNYSTIRNVYRCLFIRGGTGVIFNNRFTGDFDVPIHITNYRSCCSRGAICDGWGECNGSNPLDGNLDDSGYPCRDQIGRVGDGPDKDNIQDLEPLYEWNNVFNGKDADIIISEGWGGCTRLFDHIKENRDYYNDAKRPGYVPFQYPHSLSYEKPLPPKIRFIE